MKVCVPYVVVEGAVGEGHSVVNSEVVMVVYTITSLDCAGGAVVNATGLVKVHGQSSIGLAFSFTKVMPQTSIPVIVIVVGSVTVYVFVPQEKVVGLGQIVSKEATVTVV